MDRIEKSSFNSIYRWKNSSTLYKSFMTVLAKLLEMVFCGGRLQRRLIAIPVKSERAFQRQKDQTGNIRIHR
jgi:hypothetical protein